MDNLSQYFPWLITLTPLILFWQQSQNFVLKLLRVFLKERTIPYDFSYVCYEKLTKNSFVFNFDDYNLHQAWYYSLKHNKYVGFLFKIYSFEFVLYRYFIPIFILGTENGNIKIRYFKFTLNFDKFLGDIANVVYKDSINLMEAKSKNRFCIEVRRGLSLKSGLIEKNNNNTLKESSPSSSPSPSSANKQILDFYRIVSNKIPDRVIGMRMEDISITGMSPLNKNKYIFTEQGQYILSQVERWLKAESFYQEKNIVFRRSMLLNGKPGMGKSSLILEIAKKLGIPIFIFDLQSFDNQEFEKAIESLTIESGIILFEDLDVIWDGRKNAVRTEQYGGLTFDCFINKLSGVNSIKNKFIFITTNHLDKIDPAILRKGRVDEIIDIEPLNYNEKLKMATIVLEDNQELINKAMNNTEKLSTAEFENRVVDIALNNFWKDK